MWWGVGRAKRNLLVLWLTVWRMEDVSVLPGRPHPRGCCVLGSRGDSGAPLARPSATTHRLVHQSQQVLLSGVQESDPRPAGPPNQVGAQSEAEQSQQPRRQGGQQARTLRGEEAA